MSLLPIVKYPDPVLRQESEAVGEVNDEIRKLVKDMAETMYAADGAGLAAIQVGRPLRLFMVDSVLAGKDHNAPPLVFM